VGVVSIQWLCVGYTWAFGPGNPVWGDFTFGGLNGVGGDPNPDYGSNVSHLVFCFFQLMFAIITPALIVGALTERMKFASFLIFMFIWTTLVYDPIVHWMWSTYQVSGDNPSSQGWLRNLGAIDFAGGIVIHLTAGVASIVATLILGPRRFSNRGEIDAHNKPFVWIGGGLLWFGWFGFNGGSENAINSVAIQASFNTQIAASTGLIVYMILESIFTKDNKPTSVGAITGAICALACITPGSGYVGTGASIVFGIVVPSATFFLTRFKEKLVYDDSLDVFAAHGLGGGLGALLTGLFAQTSINPSGPNGAFYGNPRLFGVQLLACIVAMALSGFVTAACLFILKATPLHIVVSLDTENVGLDKKYHSEKAYNDIANNNDDSNLDESVDEKK